jgi:hypothetical protein
VLSTRSPGISSVLLAIRARFAGERSNGRRPRFTPRMAVSPEACGCLAQGETRSTIEGGMG